MRELMLLLIAQGVPLNAAKRTVGGTVNGALTMGVTQLFGSVREHGNSCGEEGCR